MGTAGHESYSMATPTASALTTAFKHHPSSNAARFEETVGDEVISSLKGAFATAPPRSASEASSR